VDNISQERQKVELETTSFPFLEKVKKRRGLSQTLTKSPAGTTNSLVMASEKENGDYSLYGEDIAKKLRQEGPG
jgi:hypothetical protein